MQIRQLEYFVAVSEHLSFTKAAQQFFVSQSAITLQIKALEEELGVPLFIRDNRHVSLTPAGTSFLADAQAILRRADDAIERARRASTGFTGHLNIGFVKGYEQSELPAILEKFHISYPNIALHMVRDNVAELYDGILNQSLDFVWNLFYSAESLPDVSLHVIHKYPLYAVMHASHPLAHRASIKRSELKGYPNVRTKAMASRYGESEFITDVFIHSGFLPNVQYESDDIEISILAAAAGLGYSLLPGYITDHINSKENVVVVPIEGEEELMTIVGAWHSKNKNPALTPLLEQLFGEEAH